MNRSARRARLGRRNGAPPSGCAQPKARRSAVSPSLRGRRIVSLGSCCVTDDAALTGRAFFPQLIGAPFKHGLLLVLVFATVLSLIAAAASALRGGRFVHEEAGSTIDHPRPARTAAVADEQRPSSPGPHRRPLAAGATTRNEPRIAAGSEPSTATPRGDRPDGGGRIRPASPPTEAAAAPPGDVSPTISED